jgi:signal transduction histidine kinase/CRP-like cAMP-binding protein
LRSDLSRLFLLGVTLGAPFLPVPWSALVLLALLLISLARRPPRREAVIIGVSLSVAILALAVRWEAELRRSSSEAEWVETAGRQYARLWDDLRTDAAAGAQALGKPPGDMRTRLDAFGRLSRIESDSARGRRSLLLLDADGAAVAWAGEGLLHEVDPERVPRSGLSYQASFGAVTLFAVQPLPSDRQARRPWRVVAGASFSTDTLPFPAIPRRLRWSLVDSPAAVLSGSTAVLLTGAPTLVVSHPGQEAEPAGRPWTLHLAWAGIAFAFIALAVMRGVGLVLPQEREAGREPEREPERGPERHGWVALLFLSGVFAVGMAAALPPALLALLGAGVGLAAAGLAGTMGEQKAPQDGPSPLTLWRWTALRGGLAAVLLCAAAWLFQGQGPPLDLSAGILADPEPFSVRFAFAAAAFGLLCLAGLRRGAETPPGDRWAWGAVLALLAGAALADYPAAAVALLAAGTGAGAVYADRRRLGHIMSLAALALMAVLLASGGSEVAYRLRLRSWSAGDLLTQLVPPSAQQNAAVKEELRVYLEKSDLWQVAPRSPAGLNRQDLAFTLWRGSPLSRPHALSALVVLPQEGVPSSFSFGLPTVRSGRLDWSPERWEDLALPMWGNTLITGETEIRFAGKPWGTARYWLMPRPGFQLGDRRRLEDVEIGLLRGGPDSGPFEEEQGPLLYALYAPDGRAAVSPWEEAPPLPRALRLPAGRRQAAGRMDTPSGRAYTYVHAMPEGWEVVYVPVEKPLDALERVANASLGVLLLLALCAPPVLLLALPRAAFRDVLWRAVRSYSKRLIIVYTVLLLVPLLLLNAVLIRSMEDRLRRQQRNAGESALTAAQKILGERLLNLPPGFGVDTGLGDRLLSDLSEIVRHEMNLYYGSGIYASSKHELFAAGLLPNRIPGEVYSRLSLLGYGLSSRTNRVGDAAYLEIYAPLRLPGVSGGEDRLFLSMPLLAQQEEASRELAHLRRHGLLITLSLFVLLVAVGTRLARNFTRPITELVAGTRRIAAGATSLEMSPTELELAALVEAVDDMAGRIARGREQLLREKQVVERMVENITSGVISLDRDGRVLMHNRVAAELLGARVGESLEGAVTEQEHLAPVSAFLKTIEPRQEGERSEMERGEMERTTVRLADPDGAEREWSLIWVPLPGAGEPAALLVVEDATEVLRNQRLLAWAEMARIIAHEIKNPLTPIRLSAEHMREVWRRDPEHFDKVFERCTVNILTQVEELRSIASEFSTYSAILQIDPKPGDLTAAIADLAEGYRAAPPPGVRVGLETDGPIPARFDAKLLGRAVRNLLENALRAAAAHAAGHGEVLVRVVKENSHARISVTDNGPGVRPENLPRIFDPYFSTHDTGTGLGLPIARRVVEEHGGHITARNRAEGGLEVVITLPV